MITKYNNNLIDSFLNDLVFGTNFPIRAEVCHSNDANLEKLEDKYIYKTIATGLTTEDLNIDIENNCLLVKTNSNREDNFSVNLNQKIKLKDRVDTSNITAKLEKGILEVSIPFDTSIKKNCNVTFI